MHKALLILALAAAQQAEAFTVAPHGVALRAMGSASSGASAARRPRAALALRMSEGEGDKDGKVVDPYEVKLNNGVPSFAKEENQWELDNAAGETAGDKSKKAIAITTGAFALVLSLAYLLAVVAMESRGEMKPAPEEAYGAWNMSPSEFTGAVIALLL